jgi:hypothetical protein
MGECARSTLLFARPSLAEGVGRAMDTSGVLSEYNYSDSSELADYLALLSDWFAVGEDLRVAMNQVKIEGD